MAERLRSRIWVSTAMTGVSISSDGESMVLSVMTAGALIEFSCCTGFAEPAPTRMLGLGAEPMPCWRRPNET